MNPADLAAELAATRDRLAAAEAELADLRSRPLQLQEAAAALGVNPRTIKRRLGKKETSGRWLIDRRVIERMKAGGKP